VRRRAFLGVLGTTPVWLGGLGLGVGGAGALTGCAHKEETPLAHLYGPDWVHGAYELYAGKYASIQKASEERSKDAYAMLAQKGVTALGALQTREVPFFIRVNQSEQGFDIARDVPERLTFTADMSDADRQAAQARWEKARETIQTDYEEIRRLNWALTTLLGQLQHVRTAIDDGKIEQYRLVRQLTALSQGDKPPFELPFQVTAADYRDVLTLLLERLDDDGARLARVESDIVTVGLTARATDSGSGSLAANLHKVLLAVVTDASATAPRAASYPLDGDTRGQYGARGKQLFEQIAQTPEYIKWEKHESTKAFDQLGGMLSLLDTMTGLHTSAIYQQVLDIWRGDADYLSYLKTVVKMLPGGSEVVKVADQAIDLTEKARKVAGQVQRGMALAKSASEGGVLQVAKDAGLLNAGSDFARSKLDRQLAFIKDPQELASLQGMLADSSLAKSALPAL
jgi:hypothetical protein